MPEPVRLHTERLELSVPVSADVDAITAACQDPQIARWTTVPSPYAAEDAVAFVELAERWWASGQERTWAMRGDRGLVGMISLRHRDDGIAEIGFWATHSARGMGYTAEAGRGVIAHGFRELGLARIQWRAGVGNVASARTARTLGFRYEGVLRSGLPHPGGHEDAWIAGLLPTDPLSPAPWPVLA